MMQPSTADRDMPANGSRRAVSAKTLRSSVGGTVRQMGKARPDHRSSWAGEVLLVDDVTPPEFVATSTGPIELAMLDVSVGVVRLL